MNKIADVLEKNLNLLAAAECLDNGKPIRECMAADLPLVIDHWRYFAGVIRAEEGSVAEISNSQYCQIGGNARRLDPVSSRTSRSWQIECRFQTFVCIMV